MNQIQIKCKVRNYLFAGFFCTLGLLACDSSYQEVPSNTGQISLKVRRDSTTSASSDTIDLVYFSDPTDTLTCEVLDSYTGIRRGKVAGESSIAFLTENENINRIFLFHTGRKPPVDTLWEQRKAVIESRLGTDYIYDFTVNDAGTVVTLYYTVDNQPYTFIGSVTPEKYLDSLLVVADYSVRYPERQPDFSAS